MKRTESQVVKEVEEQLLRLASARDWKAYRGFILELRAVLDRVNPLMFAESSFGDVEPTHWVN